MGTMINCPEDLSSSESSAMEHVHEQIVEHRSVLQSSSRYIEEY